MARPSYRLWAAAVTITAIAVIALSLSTDAPASAVSSPVPAHAVGRLPIGRLSPVMAGATRVGSTPESTALSFDVVLKPRDPGALARLATAVSTPGNPQYRHFLPKGRLARTFGPTPATIAAVRSSLRRAGLSPGPVSANGLIIPVTASAGRAEAALDMRIDSYRLSSGRTAVADTKAPSLPTPVASAIQAVVGLNTTLEAQSQAIQRPAQAPVGPSAAGPTAVPPAGATPCPTAMKAGGGGYTSQQLTSAYGFDPLYANGDFGTGATVALVELEPYDNSDIAEFQACYGTTVPVNLIDVDRGAGTGPGSGEAALDIENVIELAPGVDIDVYEAPNTSKGLIDDYARIAADDSGQVVSTSWGLCEAFDHGFDPGRERRSSQEMTAQGQTVLADSGDSGSADCIPRSGIFTVPTGKNPVALAADPGTGTVYVADKGSHDVSVESESKMARWPHRDRPRRPRRCRRRSRHPRRLRGRWDQPRCRVGAERDDL